VPFFTILFALLIFLFLIQKAAIGAIFFCFAANYVIIALYGHKAEPR
jgi:hypothetical protein